MMLSYLIMIFVMMVFCPMTVKGQDEHPLTRAEIDAFLNPSLMPSAAKYMLVENPVIDLGVMNEDDKKVKSTFKIKNISDSTLTITKITTDCGCTKAEIDHPVLLPGHWASVVVEYNPTNHPGTINANTLVYSNLSDIKPIAKLVLIGEVEPSRDEWSRFPYFMGRLRLKQNKVCFEASEYELQTERILCGNSGTTPLKLSVLNLPAFMEFKTEPAVIAPGQEADIVISIDKSKIMPKFDRRTFSLILGGMDIRPSDRTIKVEINLDRQ